LTDWLTVAYYKPALQLLQRIAQHAATQWTYVRGRTTYDPVLRTTTRNGRTGTHLNATPARRLACTSRRVSGPTWSTLTPGPYNSAVVLDLSLLRGWGITLPALTLLTQ